MTESSNGEKPAEPTIVKNVSQAYGYKYSSLADIAKAGIAIPKMRIKPTEQGEYIEYLDDSGEWQLGAKIIIPEMKGSNAAQAYGSALTYARRYTVQLAKSLVCDDDSKIEKQPPQKQNNKAKIDLAKLSQIRSKLPLVKTTEELEIYWRKLNLSPEYQKQLLPYFQKRKKELESKAEGVNDVE